MSKKISKIAITISILCALVWTHSKAWQYGAAEGEAYGKAGYQSIHLQMKKMGVLKWCDTYAKLIDEAVEAKDANTQ